MFQPENYIFRKTIFFISRYSSRFRNSHITIVNVAPTRIWSGNCTNGLMLSSDIENTIIPIVKAITKLGIMSFTCSLML